MPAPRLRRVLRTAALAGAAALAAGLAGLGLLWAVLPDPAALATRNPPTTALIEQRRAEAARAGRRYRPQQAWVPLERISRRLVQAVVASEDAKFFVHRGFDWLALRDAASHDLRRGRFARGASTITQQLAKNLWLGTEKSLLRKGKEAVLAAKLERALDKRRILALYLNVAEWGEGTFGVEAGARRHLGVSAGDLGWAEAVLLASMLPAPRKVDLARPSPWLRARATRLLDRLHAEHLLDDAEHRGASTALARLLGEPVPADERAEPPEDEPPEATALPGDPPEESSTSTSGSAPAPTPTSDPTSDPTSTSTSDPTSTSTSTPTPTSTSTSDPTPTSTASPLTPSVAPAARSRGAPTPDEAAQPQGGGIPSGQSDGAPKAQPPASPQE